MAKLRYCVQLLICCARHAAPHFSCMSYARVPYTCYLLPQTAVSAFLFSAPVPSLLPRAADCEVPCFRHLPCYELPQPPPQQLQLAETAFLSLSQTSAEATTQGVHVCASQASERQACGRTALSSASASHSLLWQDITTFVRHSPHVVAASRSIELLKCIPRLY